MNYAFTGCTGLTNAVIGSGVAGIGTEAFKNCSSLMGIYFKGNAPDTGENIFMNVTANIYRLEAAAASWPPVRSTWNGLTIFSWIGGSSIPLSAEQVMADDITLDASVTPQAEIAVDGTVKDWASVPCFSFNYPVGGNLTVTQEVAVALNENNIALLLTGCPFTTSDTVLVYFKLLFSTGDAANRHSVDLWTSGSVLYGMVDGQVIAGLEAVLANGVLEVKIPVLNGNTLTQVTIEEVGCGVDAGDGTMTELFKITPSPAPTQ
jgi:hypothetical protein